MTSVQKDYWEERLAKTPGLSGVGFLGLGKNYNDWLYRIKRAVFLRTMRTTGLDFGASKVLDVGCGTGFFIERWKELGVRNLVGVDLTNAAVENLRPKHRDATFYQLDIGGPLHTLHPGTFDIVSSFDVLYHIVDDVKYDTAIGNISSLLKPGGRFVWSDNFVHEATKRGVQQVCRSLQEIESILAAKGLEVVERRPCFYLMNTPVDSSNPLGKLFWRALSAAVSRSEIAGYAIGAGLYPLELVLTRWARESPSTEIMICRKAGA